MSKDAYSVWIKITKMHNLHCRQPLKNKSDRSGVPSGHMGGKAVAGDTHIEVRAEVFYRQQESRQRPDKLGPFE